MHSVSDFGRSGLPRVLSALFVVQMLSFSLLPLTATMGRSEGYRCTCCPKGKCRCGHGTPTPGGGPLILSSYSCPSQCNPASVQARSTKNLFSATEARAAVIVFETGELSPGTVICPLSRIPCTLCQRPPPLHS
jgi:hypothetical protein